MTERTPLDPLRTPADPARVLAVLGRQLAAEEIALGHASDEEIEAYVDRTGDPTERLLFEERLARDPFLAAVVCDLLELRAALEAESAPERVAVAKAAGRSIGTLLPFLRPQIRRRLVWAAAAAAALVLALVVPGRREAGPELPVAGVSAPAASAPAPAQPQKLFAEGFEAGDSSGWSSVASGS